MPPRDICPDIRQPLALAAVWRAAARRGARLSDADALRTAARIVRACPIGSAFAPCAAREAGAFVGAPPKGLRLADVSRRFPAAVAHLRAAADAYTAAHANDPGIAGCLRGFDCLFGLLDGLPPAEVARRCNVTADNLRQIIHRTKRRLAPFVADPRARRLVG